MVENPSKTFQTISPAGDNGFRAMQVRSRSSTCDHYVVNNSYHILTVQKRFNTCKSIHEEQDATSCKHSVHELSTGKGRGILSSTTQITFMGHATKLCTVLDV